MFDRLKSNGFDILSLNHAEAILERDMPDAVNDLEESLLSMSLPIEELVRGGGGEGQLTQRLRHALSDKEWEKHNFKVVKTIDGKEMPSLSHEVDHVKKFSGYTFALEIEWNNKDPFFDRDLESFQRLHSYGAISLGGIITRGISLHESLRFLLEGFALERNINSIEELTEFDYTPTKRQRDLINRRISSGNSFPEAWSHVFVSDKFGEATTHWKKLKDRVDRGVGNPCPLILIGLPSQIVIK